MSEEIPIAVIGAGHMGKNHVRVYDELAEARLVEVVEPKPENAAYIRKNYDVTVHESVTDVSEAVAASVTVPNALHRQVTENCLEVGLDVLVEKPLAMNEDDASAIIEEANRNDAILQVGHIERFNPAIETLRPILDTQDVIALEAHRLGPFSEHLSTENVIFDLMIHDLDVFSALVDVDVRSISSFGVDKRSETTDHAVAQLQFRDGILGTLTASHVTHGKVRTLSVVTDQSYITVDYQKQDVTVQRAGIEETTTLLEKSGYRTETVTESPYVQTREPLKNELEHFVECVRTGRDPRVDGEDGLSAVRLATTVLERIEA